MFFNGNLFYHCALLLKLKNYYFWYRPIPFLVIFIYEWNVFLEKWCRILSRLSAARDKKICGIGKARILDHPSHPFFVDFDHYLTMKDLLPQWISIKWSFENEWETGGLDLPIYTIMKKTKCIRWIIKVVLRHTCASKTIQAICVILDNHCGIIPWVKCFAQICQKYIVHCDVYIPPSMERLNVDKLLA